MGWNWWIGLVAFTHNFGLEFIIVRQISTSTSCSTFKSISISFGINVSPLWRSWIFDLYISIHVYSWFRHTRRYTYRIKPLMYRRFLLFQFYLCGDSLRGLLALLPFLPCEDCPYCIARIARIALRGLPVLHCEDCPYCLARIARICSQILKTSLLLQRIMRSATNRKQDGCVQTCSVSNYMCIIRKSDKRQLQGRGI